MERMGMVIKPEHIAEYKRTHAAVWPEVLARISDSNIRNYTIFLREPENLLFAYCEYHGEDWAADAKKMAADARTQEWWAIHDPMQAPLATRKAANGGRWRKKCFITTEASARLAARLSASGIYANAPRCNSLFNLSRSRPGSRRAAATTRATSRCASTARCWVPAIGLCGL